MTFIAQLLARKPKPPAEAVEALREVLLKVKGGEQLTEKLVETISKAFSNVKWLLFGDEKHEPVQEEALLVGKLSCKQGLVPLLIETLRTLPFENRKEAALVFGSVVRMHMADDSCPGADAMLQRSEALLGFLIDGYGDASIALICGQMLREAAKEARVAQAVLNSPMFYRLFKYLDAENFEIASDAISSLRDLLTRHDADEGSVVARYLETHYDEFVEAYHRILDTGNYVTKRQCLKLLGELLAHKSNKAFADKYVADETNLMKAMQRLRDEQKGIQFEAFHVFKVFVRSNARSKTATAMLFANKEKLVKYLSDFQSDKDAQDEQFAHDRQNVVGLIAALELGGNGRLSRDHSRKGLTSSVSHSDRLHQVGLSLEKHGEGSPRASESASTPKGSSPLPPGPTSSGNLQGAESREQSAQLSALGNLTLGKESDSGADAPASF